MLAHRTAARDEHNVVRLNGAAQRAMHRREIVRKDGERDGDPAGVTHQTAERKRVHVPDLAGPGRAVRRYDLVAAADNSHSRLEPHRDASVAKPRQNAEVLGAQPAAGTQHRVARAHVLAARDHVLSGAHRTVNLDDLAEHARAFLYHHGVRAGREHSACWYPNGLPRAQPERRRFAHADFADQPQPRRGGFATLFNIGGAHGKAVDGRSVKRRQVFSRHQVCGQDAVERLIQGYRLRAQRRR